MTAYNENESEWTKPEHEAINFTEQLERLKKEKESLYSTNGWSSKNVNQSSKWVVDIENTALNRNSQQEIGINLWDHNLTGTSISHCLHPLKSSSRTHQVCHNSVIPVVQDNGKDPLQLQIETLTLDKNL